MVQCCADSAGGEQPYLAAPQLRFPDTSGAAAVTASVAAAVRESLLLSAPATGLLSSALFEDFTREVAARIIQHYWRQHVSRHAAARHQPDSATAQRQGPEGLAGSQLQELAGGHCPSAGTGEEPSELIQVDSLPEMMMRYRADAGAATIQRTTSQHRLGADGYLGQSVASSAVQSSTFLPSKASSAGNGSGHGLLGAAQEATRASSSSLDRLKARHSKHRRPALLDADTAAQHAQHADSKHPTRVRQSRADSAGVKAMTAAAAVAVQQAHTMTCSAGAIKGTPGSGVARDEDERHTTAAVCEDSDSALSELLNSHRQQRAATCVEEAVQPGLAPDMQHQQQHQYQRQRQQQMPNWISVHDNSGDLLGASDENASPNLSPSKGMKQQQIAAHNMPGQSTAAKQQAMINSNAPACVSAAATALHQGHAKTTSAVVASPLAGVQAPPRHYGQVSSRQLSSDKLADIFAFLDHVEAQAEEEEAAYVLSQASAQANIQQPSAQTHPQQPPAQNTHLQLPTSLDNTQKPSAQVCGQLRLSQANTQQPSHGPHGDRFSLSSSQGEKPKRQLAQPAQGPFQERGSTYAAEMPSCSSAGLTDGASACNNKIGRTASEATALSSRSIEHQHGARNAVDTADTASTGNIAPRDKSATQLDNIRAGIKCLSHVPCWQKGARIHSHR